MAKEWYRDINFRAKSLRLINTINAVVADYQKQSLKLTLRQAFYQLVTKNIIPNTERSYKNLGNLISDARLAGLMDWDAIEDRVRRPRIPSEFDGVEQLIDTASYWYRLPRWEGQENYVELWCFPPETLVTTPAGVAPISMIAVGDEVIDRDGVARRVKSVFVRPYEGPLLEVRATGLPKFRVTPEHPMFVGKADATRPGYRGAKRPYVDPAFVEAKFVRKFDKLYVPRTTFSRDVKGEGFKGGPRTEHEPFVTFDDTFYKVAGFYLAEGSVRGDERSLQFTFSSLEVSYGKTVERWASANGFTTSVAHGAGTRVVYVYGKAAAFFFGDNFGRGSYNKRLPEWAMSLPTEKQMQILEAYFRGDSCLCNSTRDNIVLTTRSEVLARQVQLVLARCGYPAAYSAAVDHGALSHRVAVCGIHGVNLAKRWGLTTPKANRRFSHMRLTDAYVEHPVKSVREVAYSGDVYNLEVEGTNTYCVPCVVHNCEKDALAGVISPIASEYHVTLCVNRGYSSQSAMYEAGKRYIENCQDGRYPHLIYLGDMDPSGEDMVRDISDRLEMYNVGDLNVTKVALTMDQVESYKPPPNPAKMSDSRAAKYVDKHGTSSWEVDALPPAALSKIIRDELSSLVDRSLMDKIIEQENKDKQAVREMAGAYAEKQRKAKKG